MEDGVTLRVSDTEDTVAVVLTERDVLEPEGGRRRLQPSYPQKLPQGSLEKGPDSFTPAVYEDNPAPF